MKQAGIYVITCIPTGKQYVGSTSNLRSRWNDHLSHLRQGRGSTKLQNSWNKYGEQAFTYTILELVDDPEQLINREQFYIDTLHPVLNTRLFAERNSGMQFTEEHRQHLREAKADMSPEIRLKMSAAKKGIAPLKATEAAAQATRGKPRSQAVKDKISATKRRKRLEGIDTHYDQYPRDEKGRYSSEAKKEQALRTLREPIIPSTDEEWKQGLTAPSLWDAEASEE